MTDTQFFDVLRRCMPEYTPVEKIGAGSFSSVFKCERDGIFYAVKIIPVPTSDDELQMLLSRSEVEEVQAYLEEKVEQCRREIMLMAELKGNRNIANIEDYKVIQAEESLGYYIVIRMELLTSLTSYTSTYTLTRNEVIQMGIDICDALSICEKHNVIHRDIKPENILLHNDGAFKLGDFGVAKQLSGTTVGTIAGTEGFMAPEVCKGMEYNHTADIYSLGILLYYYLNNKKMPYVEAGNRSIVAEQEAIVKRMNTNEVLPYPADADENIGKIVLKACMYQKECRYQSAEEMQRDLILALHGKTIDVDLSTEGGMMLHAQTGPQDGTQDGTVSGPFTGSMIGPKPDKKGNYTGDKQTTEIETPKKKKKTGVIIGVVAAVAVLAAGGLGGMYLLEQPTTYVDENGNTVQTLTRSEMADAYTLGVQYYEQGNYENAIAELDKVTKKSSKYEEAQATMVAAMTAYKDGLIEKSNAYCANEDFETALSLLETGTALLGENTDLLAQRQVVLNQLKLNHIQKATAAEQDGEYAQAFAYIQTAAAFLPEDVELKGLYTRLDAMASMAVALQDAENYAAMGEYAKLFNTLEEAQDDVRESTTASSKIKLAYDAYKKEYLSDIESQIKNPTTVEEYSKAIDALGVAVTIFPDAYELKQKQESLQQMKFALDAIQKADQYRADNEYAKMFSLLETTQAAVRSDDEAYGKITQEYDTQKEAYMQDLLYTVGEPVSVGEYEKAIAALTEATAVLPNDSQIQKLLAQYTADKPIALFAQSYVSAKCYRHRGSGNARSVDDQNEYFTANFNAQLVDNYDNVYSENVSFIYIDSDFDNSTKMEVQYNCDGYKTLTGVAALAKECKSHVCTCKFRIWGITANDVSVMLFENSFPSGTRPQNIDVDVSDYDRLTIELFSHSDRDVNSLDTYYSPVKIILSDFTLSK